MISISSNLPTIVVRSRSRFMQIRFFSALSPEFNPFLIFRFGGCCYCRCHFSVRQEAAEIVFVPFFRVTDKTQIADSLHLRSTSLKMRSWLFLCVSWNFQFWVCMWINPANKTPHSFWDAHKNWWRSWRKVKKKCEEIRRKEKNQIVLKLKTFTTLSLCQKWNWPKDGMRTTRGFLCLGW